MYKYSVDNIFIACTSCGPIGKIILFEVARTYQSCRVSLILAYSDARRALLVCTLLPRHLIHTETGLTPCSSV